MFEYDQDICTIREGIKSLCIKFSGNYWREKDKSRSYPEEFVKALSNHGYLGCLIPEEYGGSGQKLRTAVVILEQIHRSGGNGAACHAQMYIMGTLLRHGSEEQKKKYLPEIAEGNLRLQAFGVTEPDSGTDTLSLKTTAIKNGDKFIISGQKVWTSRAEYSDLMLLLARTEDREKVKNKTEGLSVFIVDMRSALNNGLTIRPISTMLNHATTEVFIDNLEVPEENLIGKQGNGFRYIMDGMNAERILIASECIGDSRWFTSKSTSYANDRVVFNRPIGKNQGIQFPIAQAYAETEAAALMTEKAAILYEDGKSAGAEANMAKLLASEASWKAAEACMQTHGGFGFAEEYDVERKYRETRLYQIAPISTNLILSYIAEHVLGLPRSY